MLLAPSLNLKQESEIGLSITQKVNAHTQI